MGLYSGGLIIGRIFGLRFGGLIFGRFFFLAGGGGGLIIRVLRYMLCVAALFWGPATLRRKLTFLVLDTDIINTFLLFVNVLCFYHLKR